MSFTSVKRNTKSNQLILMFAAFLTVEASFQNWTFGQGVRLSNPILNGANNNKSNNSEQSFLKLRGTANQDPKPRIEPSNTSPQNLNRPGTPLIQPSMGPHPRMLPNPSKSIAGPRNNGLIPQHPNPQHRDPRLQHPDPRFQNVQGNEANAPFVQPNANVPKFSIPNPRVPDSSHAGSALPNGQTVPNGQVIQPNSRNPLIASDLEVIKERYNNGAIKIERQVIQDNDKNYINHGFWKYYLPNGRVAAQAHFVKGKKSGAWSRWLTPKEVPLFKTAPLNQFQAPFLTTFHYVNDTLHGKWKLADSANRTVFEINLKNGKRDSLCVWYLANGQKHQEIHYKDGVLHGTFMKWNIRGKLTEKRQFENGHEIGHITEFHRPGVKKLEYGVLAGKVESLTMDNPWNVEFATEKKIGPDIKHGPVSAWYPNGQVRFTGHFKQDVQQGSFVWYYQTGQKQAEGSFANDQRVNLWVWWHENGMRASVGKYAQGSPVGNWQWWSANGQLARSQEFDADSTRLGESDSNATETMKNASFRNGEK